MNRAQRRAMKSDARHLVIGMRPLLDDEGPCRRCQQAQATFAVRILHTSRAVPQPFPFVCTACHDALVGKIPPLNPMN